MSMTLISTVTVGSGGATSINFASIPQTYTDLIIKISTRTTNYLYDQVQLKPNGSASNISARVFYGTGSSAASTTFTDGYIAASSSPSFTASSFSNVEVYIPNYTSSNYKSVSVDGVIENNGTLAYATLTAYLWSNTSAITSILLTPNGSEFAEYSSASIYGVLKGSGGATVS